jgi:hypothetical protein
VRDRIWIGPTGKDEMRLARRSHLAWKRDPGSLHFFQQIQTLFFHLSSPTIKTPLRIAFLLCAISYEDSYLSPAVVFLVLVGPGVTAQQSHQTTSQQDVSWHQCTGTYMSVIKVTHHNNREFSTIRSCDEMIRRHRLHLNPLRMILIHNF